MKKIDKAYRGTIRLIIKIAVLVGVLCLIFNTFLGLTRIEGGAMSGRLEDGDLALYVRTNENYAEDDIIIFEHEGQTHISSVIAMPGDLIKFDEGGYLYVNNVKQSELIIYDADQGEELGIAKTYRVPNGSYFVLNNNPESTDDSRVFGAISAQNIKGKLIGILRTRAL